MHFFGLTKLEPWSIGMVSLTITARAMLPNGPGVKSAGSLASIKPNIACGLGQKEKIKKAASFKLQARLTMDPGACRMNLEREENNEGNHISK